MKRTLPTLTLPLLWACAHAEVPDLPSLGPTRRASRRVTDDIRVTALRVGFVRVRPTHYEGSGPSAVRISRIMMEWSWSAWMPVMVYLIEHPDGAVLVDTGLNRNIAMNPANHKPSESLSWFYRSNLQFYLPPDDDLKAQLGELGVPPSAVKHVVLTHLHADHTGNVDLFPTAKMWTGDGNWPSHLGSVWRGQMSPTLVPDGKPGTKQPLTWDERIQIVRLPGHTEGHVGVAIKGTRQNVYVVGDATFSVEQTVRGGVSGISENMDDAHHTQELLRSLSPQTLILPAHDPTVFERLERTE